MERIDFSVERKIEPIFNKPIIFMLIIGSISFTTRIFFLPQNLPVTFDGLLYFSYATDITVLGSIPDYYHGPNDGWPIFLSVFFLIFHSIFHLSSFLDYMLLQRIISVFLSTLTLIPIYYLCRKFFDVKYSLVGSALFVFEPRIIQNSTLGITEPLFIILLTSSLCLLLSNDVRKNYISFAVLALATLVRYEGVLMIVVFSIIFIINNRKKEKIIFQYFLVLIIFVLVLAPMTIWKVHTTGQDGITNQVSAGAQAGFILTQNEKNQTLALISFVANGVITTVKYLAWVMIPSFVFFTPIGLFLLFREKRHRLFVILSISVLIIPALYAYSRGYQETRYLAEIYPLFCILAIFTIERFVGKITSKHFVLSLIIIGIVLSSILFLIIKQTDTQHKLEAFEVSKKISNMANGVNSFEPEQDYLSVASLPNEWPTLTSKIQQKTKIIEISGFKTLDEFIRNSESKGLTHLVIDDNQDRPTFIKDVFRNEKNYPYLEKMFDSSETDSKYKVKIFKINYSIFNSNH